MARPARAARPTRQRPQGPNAAEWNAQHRPGTRVVYRSHPSAEPLETATRSAAWTLPNGEAVVSIEGRTGGVALWALEVVPPDPAWAFVAKVASVMEGVTLGNITLQELAAEARALLEGRDHA